MAVSFSVEDLKNPESLELVLRQFDTAINSSQLQIGGDLGTKIQQLQEQLDAANQTIRVMQNDIRRIQSSNPSLVI